MRITGTGAAAAYYQAQARSGAGAKTNGSADSTHTAESGDALLLETIVFRREISVDLGVARIVAAVLAEQVVGWQAGPGPRRKKA